MGKKGNHGGGTVYKKGNKFQGAYYKPDGSRGYVSAKNKRDCRAKLVAAMADADRGLTFDAGKQTVGEHMTRWLEDYAKPKLAPRTYHNYKLQLRKHIIPALGTMKLSKLDTPNIQVLYADKLREGMAPSSVRYIHAVLRRGLGKAVDLRLIPRNPAASAEPPQIREDEITPLNREQANAFLDAARGQKFECLYVLSLTCGLRMGEALGLKWSDIDLVKGTLRVARQLQRMRRDGDSGAPGTLKFSEPKNASRWCSTGRNARRRFPPHAAPPRGQGCPPPLLLRGLAGAGACPSLPHHSTLAASRSPPNNGWTQRHPTPSTAQALR
ncbi:MAG: hypothetical protein H0T57_09800 [Rubrobacter sp.]|nr:hypothetical protein [Rubrobacter sp.]